MPIVLFIVLGFLLIDTIGVLILSKIEQEERISIIFKARRIAKIVLLVELNALNFSFVFLPIKYAGELFLVILVNASVFFYFLFDLLYLSERKREYLLWLQEIVFSHSDLCDVFDLLDDDGSKYEEIRVFPKQMCSIVKKEHKLCIQVGSDDKKYFLIPKKELSKETLTLYCQKFELDAEKRKDLKLYPNDVNPVALKEFDNSSLLRSYTFLNKKIKPKLSMILTIGFIVIMLIIVINILICLEVLHKDPFDWMAIIL